MAKDHFDFLAERIAAATALSELEARGTLRLALKASGLDAKNASAQALRVVVERVLSRELRARGVSPAGSPRTRPKVRNPAQRRARRRSSRGSAAPDLTVGAASRGPRC
jgi:hypothetical protein